MRIPSLVGRDAEEADARGAEDLERAEVGRLLDDDDVPGGEERPRDEVEPLLRARRDEDLLGARADAARDHVPAERLSKRRDAFRRAVEEGLGSLADEDLLLDAPQVLQRKELGGGETGLQADDVVPLGEGQDVADERVGLADAAVPRELPPGERSGRLDVALAGPLRDDLGAAPDVGLDEAVGLQLR